MRTVAMKIKYPLTVFQQTVGAHEDIGTDILQVDGTTLFHSDDTSEEVYELAENFVAYVNILRMP